MITGKISETTSPHRIYEHVKALLWMATLVTILLWWPVRSHGENRVEERKVSDNLLSNLQYLIDFVSKDNPEAFSPDRIEHVLNFVDTAETDSVIYHTGNAFGASSAYDAFDIQSSLENILKLAYHPDIPGHIFSPSSIRLTYWKEVEGYGRKFPALWRLMTELKDPVVVRGVEYLENTPDLFTGAYYGYELDRTFCLFRYNGRNAMVSLSKQKTISDVGKKGFVLGSDDDWDYFYSDDEGLSKSGLGWVRSYMYDSFAVGVYLEDEEAHSSVRFGIFKWIHAGWGNMNFVKNKHIYSGLKRFGKTFKALLEDPNLPGASEMARFFSRIEVMSETELKKETKKYFMALKLRYPESKILSGKGFSNLFNDDGYLSKMKKEEMQSALALEYMKSLLDGTHMFQDPYSVTLREIKR